MIDNLPDVYFDKTKSRNIKLNLYLSELGQCLDVQAALTALMRSFIAPPALNLRPDGKGTWLNVNTGETLTAREINRRYLVWMLEMMKDEADP